MFDSCNEDCDVGSGSTFPFRYIRMLLFTRNLATFNTCHPRTTAAAELDFLDGVAERQVPWWTSRSPRKLPRTGFGHRRHSKD